MMTRPPNQHPGHPYWVRGCESCSGRMSPVSHQCQRDNQVRFRTLRRLQSQPHNQSNFAFVSLFVFPFPFISSLSLGRNVVNCFKEFLSKTQELQLYECRGASPLQPGVFGVNILSPPPIEIIGWQPKLDAGVYSQRAWLLWDQLHSLRGHGQQNYRILRCRGFERMLIRFTTSPRVSQWARLAWLEAGNLLSRWPKLILWLVTKSRWVTRVQRTGWRFPAQRPALPAARSRLWDPLRVFFFIANKILMWI